MHQISNHSNCTAVDERVSQRDAERRKMPRLSCVGRCVVDVSEARQREASGRGYASLNRYSTEQKARPSKAGLPA
jgi:hypothetical protein